MPEGPNIEDRNRLVELLDDAGALLSPLLDAARQDEVVVIVAQPRALFIAAADYSKAGALLRSVLPREEIHELLERAMALPAPRVAVVDLRWSPVLAVPLPMRSTRELPPITSAPSGVLS